MAEEMDDAHAAAEALREIRQGAVAWPSALDVRPGRQVPLDRGDVPIDAIDRRPLRRIGDSQEPARQVLPLVRFMRRRQHIGIVPGQVLAQPLRPAASRRQHECRRVHRPTQGCSCNPSSRGRPPAWPDPNRW
jgi:hypothetical protein